MQYSDFPQSLLAYIAKCCCLAMKFTCIDVQLVPAFFVEWAGAEWKWLWKILVLNKMTPAKHGRQAI